MLLKISSVRFHEFDEKKTIDVVVDVIGEDGRGLAQTWVKIPYEENITTRQMQDLALELAKEKLQGIAK